MNNYKLLRVIKIIIIITTVFMNAVPLKSLAFSSMI